MCQLKNDIEQGRIKGGEVQEAQPPPPSSIFRFSLKSEGKEVKKEKKLNEGGG